PPIIFPLIVPPLIVMVLSFAVPVILIPPLISPTVPPLIVTVLLLTSLALWKAPKTAPRPVGGELSTVTLLPVTLLVPVPPLSRGGANALLTSIMAPKSGEQLPLISQEASLLGSA
ncbi:hypothetical protein, partial [Phocoenobacter skyensis]|uniref:hypothetical protein n=1 Tax=Phocoenobacter skyensis TaxID=97481 RepID=UPI002795E243